jgi:hypothetical protein
MKLSPRELIILFVALAAALFGGTIILAKPKIETWKKLWAEQKVLKVSIDAEKELVAQKDVLGEKLGQLSKTLESFPPRQKMGVYWHQVLDKAATKNNVRIVESRAGQEEEVGDVYELPIECKSCEADLPSMVHFLFDLQSEGAMLDVRKLRITPKQKSTLRASFTLFCAYTKSEASSPETAGTE